MKNTLIAIKWITAIAGILVMSWSTIINSQLLFCIGVILEECAVIAYLYIDLKYGVSQQVPEDVVVSNREIEIEIGCSPDDIIINKEWEEFENQPRKVYDSTTRKPVTDIMTNSEITAACIKAGITDPVDIAWVQIVNESPIIVQARVQARIEILKSKYK